MVKAQIRLDETQHRRLKTLAAQRSTTVSQLIRDGVDRVLAAAAVEAARRRHADLVDKKSTQALSNAETAELKVLERNLDAAEAALYRPVLHRLTADVTEIRAGSSGGGRP